MAGIWSRVAVHMLATGKSARFPVSFVQGPEATPGTTGARRLGKRASRVNPKPLTSARCPYKAGC